MLNYVGKLIRSLRSMDEDVDCMLRGYDTYEVKICIQK
jgi:hypothetical protein